MPPRVCTHPWEFRVEPFRIAGGLFYAGNADVSAHLLDTGDGLVLFDTGYPQTLYLLLEAIRSLGFKPADIRWILHTHGHYDHFGGTRALVELTGAETAMGEQDLAVLSSRPELSWAPEYGVEFHESFAVDLPLQDGRKLKLGGATVECVHTPGHTAGGMTFFFDVNDQGRTLVAALHAGIGRNTLAAAYLAKYGLPVSRRDEYLASCEKLMGRHVDITLGPHPGQNDTLGKRARMTAGSNPFVDSGEWSKLLSDMERKARRDFAEDPV